MPFGQDGVGLFALVVCIEPSRRLRQKECEQGDQTGEKELQPDGDEPRVVALDVETTTDGPRRQDRAHQPGAVAKTTDDTTILGDEPSQ